MIQQAASLGLDSQVRALLHGSPLERAVARIVVRGAVQTADERAKRHAVYIGNVVGGNPPEGR